MNKLLNAERGYDLRKSFSVLMMFIDRASRGRKIRRAGRTSSTCSFDLNWYHFERLVYVDCLAFETFTVCWETEIQNGARLWPILPTKQRHAHQRLRSEISADW